MDVGAKGASQQAGVGVHHRPSQAPVLLLLRRLAAAAPPLWLLTRTATTGLEVAYHESDVGHQIDPRILPAAADWLLRATRFPGGPRHPCGPLSVAALSD
jgi:hypothetical protein